MTKACYFPVILLKILVKCLWPPTLSSKAYSLQMERAEILAWITLNSCFFLQNIKGHMGRGGGERESLLLTYHQLNLSSISPTPTPWKEKQLFLALKPSLLGEFTEKLESGSFDSVLTPRSSLLSAHVILFLGLHSIPGRSPITNKMQIYW